MRHLIAPALARARTVFRFLPASAAAALTACAGSMPAPVASPAPVMRVEVVAHPDWWQVRYLPATAGATARAGLLEAVAGGPQLVRAAARAQDALTPIVLANELRIPVGSVVEVHMPTQPEPHALEIPAFAGDIRGERGGALVLEAAAPGEYRGTCLKSCGGLQPRAALRVIAEPAAAHHAWLARQVQPAAAPVDAFGAAGREVFMRAGCGSCHAIRGTAARGNSGPDLTHVASRRGADLMHYTLTHDHARGSQQQPAHSVLAGDEVRALTAYLAALH